MALDTNIVGTNLDAQGNIKTSIVGTNLDAEGNIKISIASKNLDAQGNVKISVADTNLDAQGNVKTSLTLAPTEMGGVRFFSENDIGSATGIPYLKSPETSTDFRLRVGVDSVWDDENFNYTAQNFNKHRYTSNTLTMAWGDGFLRTNATSVTTTGTACQLRTYRNFPLQGSGGIYCEVTMALSNELVANCDIDFGMFLPGAAGTDKPLNGAYFRVSNDGMAGVVNNNGLELLTNFFAFAPIKDYNYKYTLVLTDGNCEFWIDDVLYGSLLRPIERGSILYAGSAPFAIRHHHTGVTSNVMQARVANYTISMSDMDNVRLWSHNKAGQGLSGIQYSSGGGVGMTGNNINNTAPGVAVLANATASYATLGGKFAFAARVGAETDYALFAFLNPDAALGVTGRNLVINGVWIDTYNAVVAVATAPTVLEWSLAVGSTAVSLLTVDGATSRLPKRLSLGVQGFTVGAPPGQAALRVVVDMDTPVVCEPGTFVHVILRIPYGAATANEIFRGQIGFNSYWE